MKKKILDNFRAGWIFLGIVLVAYAVLGAVNYGMLGQVVLSFWNLFISVLPIILLVFGLVFLTNLFMTQKRIMKYLGEGSGVRGWILMIVGGIISSGPIYMWYPLLKDLKMKGMKNSLIAVFLYNRALKIFLIPIMIFYFGWVFTILLTLYMIVFSVINGIIVGRIVGNE